MIKIVDFSWLMNKNCELKIEGPKYNINNNDDEFYIGNVMILYTSSGLIYK